MRDDDPQLVDLESRLRHLERHLTEIEAREESVRGRVERAEERADELSARAKDRRGEAELQAERRMRALSLLAGGIAHDFNNLLTAIMGHAELIRYEDSPREEIEEAAEVIQGAAERAARLTSQLLAFAQRGKHQHTAIDIHELIRAAIEPLADAEASNIEVVLRLEAKAQIVEGDPAQLEQALTNLAVNARRAVEGGGTVVVATSNIADPEGSAPDDPVVLEINVTDDGRGVSPDHLDHVFEPFSATPEAGGSPGLELAMVYGIVKSHGGNVSVESEAGEGTTFRVRLPGARPAGTRDDEATAAFEGSGLALVIDDEPGVRHVLRGMLRRLGFEVATAENGLEGVRRFDELARPVRIVLLDLTMPVMDGFTCFRELRERKPTLPILVVTGHSFDSRTRDLEELEGVVLLSKPFVLDDLNRALGRLLGHDEPGDAE